MTQKEIGPRDCGGLQARNHISTIQRNSASAGMQEQQCDIEALIAEVRCSTDPRVRREGLILLRLAAKNLAHAGGLSLCR